MSQVSFFDEINTTAFIFVTPRSQPEMKRLLPAAAVFVAWYEMARLVGMHAYSLHKYKVPTFIVNTAFTSTDLEGNSLNTVVKCSRRRHRSTPVWLSPKSSLFGYNPGLLTLQAVSFWSSYYAQACSCSPSAAHSEKSAWRKMTFITMHD